MRRDTKVIITCAVSGNAPFNAAHPSFPITPAEIAASANEAADAGAAIVHLHARDPETTAGVTNTALFEEITKRVRDLNPDVLINLTGGGGAFFVPSEDDEARGAPESDVLSVDQRMEHLEKCLPDIASLDLNTSNQTEGAGDFVYLNTPRTLRAMSDAYKSLNIKPELEVFNAGDIEFGKQLIKEGRISGDPMFQFVLGVKWQDPADTLGMLYLRNRLPHNAIWGALGISREEMPVAAQTAILGGNVRVGLEDNLYLRKGIFGTNGELVAQARRIVEDMGFEVATPDEARKILGIN